jgi:SAM-dependent methyltransferase
VESHPTPPGGVYVHGDSPREQQRLSRLNDLLNRGSLREIDPQPGERLVDFGSGLGQLSRAIARRTGRAGHVGIERSEAQLTRARALAADAGEGRLVDFRKGEAASPPLRDDEWGSFDVAHARFLLEHVPNPLDVVRTMVAAVRPGGRVVLEDDDHDLLRLWPEPPGFSTLWHAYVRIADGNGNDAFVGRRLVALLRAAGARPRRTAMVFFGGCAGTEELELMVENVVGVFDGVGDLIIARFQIGAEEYQSAMTAFRKWATRPDAAFWYAIPLAEGVRAQ